MARESTLNGRARDAIRAARPSCVIYKLADRFTSGIPDTVVNADGFTSWLEFKHLGATESIHDQLDPLQLVECVKLEHQTGRAWVVAYRKPVSRCAHETLTIYRPTFLWGQRVPPDRAASYVSMLSLLMTYGNATFATADHRAVAQLIAETHSATYRLGS